MRWKRRLSELAMLLMMLIICPMLGQKAARANDSIPVGTKITMQNWSEFRQFMPDGMIALFQGWP